MRRYGLFTLPLVFLVFAGCADQATAPEVELIISEKKPIKPPPDPVGSANPVITFAAGTPGKRSLWVVDANGKNATEIYIGGYMMHSSWSDQGSGTPSDPWVILVSQAGSAPQALEKLEVVLEAGVPTVQNSFRLADESSYFGARVKPGGTHFVAVDVYNPLGNSLVMDDMDPETPENPVLIYRPGDDLGVAYLTWSPGGDKVAFLEYSDSHREVKVRIVDIESHVVAPPLLTLSWVDNGVGNVSWSRTTNELLLDFERVLYRVDIGDPDLSNSIGEGRTAVWSPNDAQIVYQDGGLFVKTFGVPKDKRLPGGSNPDWRRNPGG